LQALTGNLGDRTCGGVEPEAGRFDELSQELAPFIVRDVIKAIRDVRQTVLPIELKRALRH
jgi:ABC-type branched-subunit amino acid transport system ATPase component